MPSESTKYSYDSSLLQIMPFAVVQTTNARGCNELSVVPASWLRGSRSGNILLWPNVKSVAEQERLLRDENSSPKKSWVKYKCKVKRNPIASFNAAKRMLDDLSGESSSEVSNLVRRKRKPKNNEANNFQEMLILNDTPCSSAAETTSSSVPIVIEVRGGVQGEIQDEFPRGTTSSPRQPPATVLTNVEDNVQNAQGEILQQPLPVLPVNGITTLSEDNVPEIQTVQYVAYDTADTVVEPGTQQCFDTVIKQLQETNSRLERLEKRIASIGTQNEFMLDAVRKFISHTTNIEQPSSFCFDPIKDENELADLENKLTDNDFKLKMVNLFYFNLI